MTAEQHAEIGAGRETCSACYFQAPGVPCPRHVQGVSPEMEVS